MRSPERTSRWTGAVLERERERASVSRMIRDSRELSRHAHLFVQAAKMYREREISRDDREARDTWRMAT